MTMQDAARWAEDLWQPLWRPTTNPLNFLNFFLLGLTLLALPACTHRQQLPVQPPTATQHIEMEPLQLLAERKDGRVVISHRDAASLFREAGDAFEAQDYARSVQNYRNLLTEFPESSYVNATLFNLGLSLEALNQFEEARSAYRTLIKRDISSSDALDARFRTAVCERELGRHEAEAATLREILTLPDLGREDRLLAQIRLGDALLAMGNLDEAELMYRSILARPALKGTPAPLNLPPQVQAQAQFGVARVEHERFLRIPIRLPQDQMQQDIHNKANSFLRAQTAYLKTIHTKVSDYVTAAGLQVGALYEDFYKDLMAAPVPAELNSEEVEVYFEELRKEIRPLVDQAVHVYERNLLYADRFGLGNAQVDQSRTRLERLRRFLSGDRGGEPGQSPEANPASPLFIGPPEPPDLAARQARATVSGTEPAVQPVPAPGSVSLPAPASETTLPPSPVSPPPPSPAAPASSTPASPP